METTHVTILGVPFNGIGVPPADENPAQAIREAGLNNFLRARGASVSDYGDLEIPMFDGHRDESTQVLNLAALKEMSLRISDRMVEIHKGNSILLILGGDCGILIGIIGAYVRLGRKIGLVMLDGHADFRDPASSPSGEAADIPLWVLTGRGPAELAGLFNRIPMLNDDMIAVFGFREPDMIDQSSIIRIHRDHIAVNGIASAVKSGLQPLLDQSLDLWLHLDVDVIDPAEMPAVHFPEPGGLSFADTMSLARQIMDTGRVLGLSVTCYHNNVDGDGSAGIKLARLISEILT